MFLPYFGNMVQRVVSEEVEKAKFKQFSAAAPPRIQDAGLAGSRPLSIYFSRSMASFVYGRSARQRSQED